MDYVRTAGAFRPGGLYTSLDLPNMAGGLYTSLGRIGEWSRHSGQVCVSLRVLVAHGPEHSSPTTTYVLTYHVGISVRSSWFDRRGDISTPVDNICPFIACNQLPGTECAADEKFHPEGCNLTRYAAGSGVFFMGVYLVCTHRLPPIYLHTNRTQVPSLARVVRGSRRQVSRRS